MEITERNSRLLLVAGGVGLSGILFNLISKVIRTSYSSFRINSEIPMSISQLFSSLLLSSFVILLGLAIIYCYFELFSYSNLEDEKKTWYLKQADRYYVYILRYFAVSLALIVAILTIYSFVVEYLYLANYIIKWTFIIISIIFLLLGFIKNVREIAFKIVKNAFGMLKGLFNETFFTISMASILSWLLCFIFTIGVGIKSNTDAKMEMVFNNEDYIMTIKYEDKMVDYFPENFLIWVESEGEVVQEVIIDSKDFKRSYINVIGEYTNNNDKEMMINKNTIKYSYDFQLNEITKLKEGIVYIQFEKDDFFKTETYTIANNFVNQKGEYIFDFPDVNLDF